MRLRYMFSAAKRYSPIYNDSFNIGPVSGGGVVTKSAGGRDMVLSGRIGLGGSAGNVKGGGVRVTDVRIRRRSRDQELRWRS